MAILADHLKVSILLQDLRTIPCLLKCNTNLDPIGSLSSIEMDVWSSCHFDLILQLYKTTCHYSRDNAIYKRVMRVSMRGESVTPPVTSLPEIALAL